MDSFRHIRACEQSGPPKPKTLDEANAYLRHVWRERNGTARGRLYWAWCALTGWSVAIIAILWGLS